MEIRPTTPEDFDIVAALLSRSYGALLPADYDAATMDAALPLITRPRPELLSCGTYYLLSDGGLPRACGGWTGTGPQGEGLAHIRHVACAPDALRRGYARALVGHCLLAARAAGHTQIGCYATLTAAPFYAAMGFDPAREFDLILPTDIPFRSVEMHRPL